MGQFLQVAPAGGGYKSFFPSLSAKTTSTSPFIFRLQTGHCRFDEHFHRINLNLSDQYVFMLRT